jgi:hypothetical protein
MFWKHRSIGKLAACVRNAQNWKFALSINRLISYFSVRPQVTKLKQAAPLYIEGRKMKVEEYLQKQKSPQKEICQQLRTIILRTFPSIKEEMKWGVPTYAEGKYYIVSLKEQVNLGFSMINLSKEEQQGF